MPTGGQTMIILRNIFAIKKALSGDQFLTLYNFFVIHI